MVLSAKCWNKTIVAFAKIGCFAQKPETQCIGRKKLGFFHPCTKTDSRGLRFHQTANSVFFPEVAQLT